MVEWREVEGLSLSVLTLDFSAAAAAGTHRLPTRSQSSCPELYNTLQISSETLHHTQLALFKEGLIEYKSRNSIYCNYWYLLF